MLWEYRILFLSKFLQIFMKFDHPVYQLTNPTIHNKPVILAILICEKYLMSSCLFSSKIIYLAIPVQFKGCFGDTWMYAMYIYFL